MITVIKKLIYDEKYEREAESENESKTLWEEEGNTIMAYNC